MFPLSHPVAIFLTVLVIILLGRSRAVQAAPDTADSRTYPLPE